MKLTIELAERHADLLADWASVQRTLTQALRLAGDDDCADELEAIIPAIDAAQMAIREAVWAIKPDRTESRKRNRLG